MEILLLIDLELGELIMDLLKKFGTAFQNFIGALIVFLIGWIFAKTISKVIAKALKKIGIDKLAEKLNEIDIIDKANIKIVPSAFLSKVIYYILLLIFIIAATDVLGMPAVSQLMSDILNYLPSLISALIVFILGILIADFLKGIVKTACESLNIPAAGLIATVVFYFIFLNVVMITLTQAGIDTDFIQDNLSIILAGGVAAFALGYGMASKDIVASLLASFYNKGKVNVGDKIVIDGVEGEVIDIDNTCLILKAGKDKIIVPLSKLSANSVILKDPD
jgi:hypothetical protein